MLSVYIETYGCQMNVADSSLLADLLAQEGYEQSRAPEGADLVVVNTCSVRENAESRARARISELAHIKAKRTPYQQIWVVGCMAQRLGEQLIADIPGVNRVIGAEQIESLHEHIREYLQKSAGSLTARTAATGVTAFVPIMRGCDNFCAYCIVPYVRGREHSVPAGEVEQTVRGLIDSGVREVTLLGQNVNSYRDPVGGAGFDALLRRLHGIEGLARLRFTTSHPKDCSPELIETIAELPRLCKHLHLPVQSGSTSVLTRMNRGYTRDTFLRTCELLRKRVPGIDITTDVMTGFPGETDREFGDTLSLFEQVRFTTAFMFAFSPRSGTAAATMPAQVDPAVARERLARLIELQTSITRSQYEQMVGRSIEVLVTERQTKRDQNWMAQDAGCKRVLVCCDRDLAGAILRVRVRSSSGMTLLAEPEDR